MSVVFVDTETTGLDPERHQVWDLAIIDKWGEYEYHFKPALANAEPMALQIGRYYERTTAAQWRWNDPQIHAEEIARRLNGNHLVASNPAFDAAFIARFLRQHGQQATWNYHLIDISALMLGYLARKVHENFEAGYTDVIPVPIPWKSRELAAAVGVPQLEGEEHTALGDARWAKAVFETVMGEASA